MVFSIHRDRLRGCNCWLVFGSVESSHAIIHDTSISDGKHSITRGTNFLRKDQGDTLRLLIVRDISSFLTYDALVVCGHIPWSNVPLPEISPSRIVR